MGTARFKYSEAWLGNSIGRMDPLYDSIQRAKSKQGLFRIIGKEDQKTDADYTIDARIDAKTANLGWSLFSLLLFVSSVSILPMILHQQIEIRMTVSDKEKTIKIYKYGSMTLNHVHELFFYFLTPFFHHPDGADDREDWKIRQMHEPVALQFFNEIADDVERGLYPAKTE